MNSHIEEFKKISIADIAAGN